MYMMAKIYFPVHSTAENRNKLRNQCKKIFLKYHPEFAAVKITDDFILSKVLNKYIEDDSYF